MPCRSDAAAVVVGAAAVAGGACWRGSASSCSGLKQGNGQLGKVCKVGLYRTGFKSRSFEASNSNIISTTRDCFGTMRPQCFPCRY